MPSVEFWQEKKNPHLPIFAHLGALEKDLALRNILYLRHLSSYLGKPITGLRPGQMRRTDPMRRARLQEQALKLNPAEGCGSALAARIASQRPRASFLTSSKGPDSWSLMRRAEDLEKYVDAEWRAGKFYRKLVKVFLHAASMGLGAMHIYPGDDDVRFDVVPPWELLVDEQAALDGETRILLREKFIPAEVLEARFCTVREGWSKGFCADNLAALKREVGGDSGGIPQHGGYKTLTSLVRAVEAWHLPSGYGADDGRHVICLSTRTLTPPEEWEWKRKRFPFAFLPWGDPLIGWYPQGLVEKGESLQGQMNKLMARIQDIAHIYAVQNTYYHEGSLTKNGIRALKNSSGNLIEMAPGATPPKTEMPPSVPADLLGFVDVLRNYYFEENGVSQLSAANIKPPGVEAAVALRELGDRESGRHALLNQTADDFVLEGAELTVEAGSEVAKRKGGYTVNHIGRHGLERIKYADMDRDKYEIQVFPSSQLPHEPGGRRAEVQELINGQFVTQEQGKRLLRMPDLEQFESLDTASYEIVEMQIEQILVDGRDDVRPLKHQDLELALALATNAVLRAGCQQAPKERIEALMVFIEAADEELQKAQLADAALQAAAQPPPQAEPGGPGPEMPPGSGPGPEMPPPPMSGGMPPGGPM